MLTKAFLIVCSSLALIAWNSTEQKKMRIFLAGDSTISIKDTKAYPETGWGMPFANFFDSTVNIQNWAKNGRSTKSFRSEGLWDSIMKKVQPEDYVLIQFGHNDQSVDKKERYATPEEFKNNLKVFVEETKAKNAFPIVITPVSRRKFDSNGIAQPTHGIYSNLVREVALETTTPIIDLDSLSRALYQKMGVEGSKLLFLQLEPGEHPNYPDGKIDNTHFSELGARLIAQIILKELRNQNSKIISHVIKK